MSAPQTRKLSLGERRLLQTEVVQIRDAPWVFRTRFSTDLPVHVDEKPGLYLVKVWQEEDLSISIETSLILASPSDRVRAYLDIIEEQIRVCEVARQSGRRAPGAELIENLAGTLSACKSLLAVAQRPNMESRDANLILASVATIVGIPE